MKTYKGFDKDLTCRGFQYEVGQEFEINGKLEMGKNGFHACESPLDVFDYYDMLKSRFCEVEQFGEIKEERSTLVCSSKIKIVAELTLADMIKLGVERLKELTSPDKNGSNGNSDNGINFAQIASSDNSAWLSLTGNYSHIASSGNNARIGSSGEFVQIASSGNSARIASSGNHEQIASSGEYSKIGLSGEYAQIASSGNHAQIGSTGDFAQIASSGNYEQIASSGDRAQIVSTGYSAQIESTGEDSVVCCVGNYAKAKAKKGSWITLAEWLYDEDKKRYVPKCVKTEYVDGERIKADTWYILKDGKFKKVKERKRRQNKTKS